MKFREYQFPNTYGIPQPTTHRSPDSAPRSSERISLSKVEQDIEPGICVDEVIDRLLSLIDVHMSASELSDTLHVLRTSSK